MVMDNNKKSLMEFTEREIAEFDKMAAILNAKLEALSKLNTQKVQEILVEELEELKHIQTVERERAKVLKELALSGKDLNDKFMLAKKLGEDETKVFMPLHSSLKKSLARVISLNGISKALLRHSIAFIRQNINILTGGGKRKLVDRKA